MSQILIILSGICILVGLLSLAVSRVPRPWRKFYQDIFEATREHSVNRNKAIDEHLIKFCAKWGIVLLIVGVTCPLLAILLRGVGPQLGGSSEADEKKALMMEQIERTEQQIRAQEEAAEKAAAQAPAP